MRGPDGSPPFHKEGRRYLVRSSSAPTRCAPWSPTLGERAQRYLQRSGQQALFGNFSEHTTLLGTAGQVATGLLGVDLPGDIRDIGGDIDDWRTGRGSVLSTTLDLAGLLPLVGALKYGDEAADVVKQATKNADEIGAAALKRGRRQAVNSVEELDGLVKRLDEGAGARIAPESGGYGVGDLLPDGRIAGEGPGAALSGSVRPPARPVLLGETMSRAEPVAERIGAGTFQPRSTNPARWMANQKRWIRRQIRSGRPIYDIGFEKLKPSRSPYYAIERAELGKAGYVREFQRWVSAEVGGQTKRFRLYQWVKR